MSNGEVCCILGVCCPPGADPLPQMRAMEEFLEQHRTGATTADSKGRKMVDIREAAKALTETFDFALKGTLSPLVQSVVAQAEKMQQHRAAEAGADDTQ